MLSVVQVIQEGEGRAGEVRKREVGCQSESAERRDAAVQVDLSCRHTGVCGVAWQCVSVRADEPGGGALLHHCSTHIPHTEDTGQHLHPSHPLYLLCTPLRHTLLPTMPLFTPPAPPDLQQTTSLPSMPLCGASPTAGGRCEASPPPTPADVSAPPPGLIAPLSPRLAEEEEEQEEEEGSFKHDINESFRGNRRSTITAEKKKKQRKSQRSDMFGEKSRVQPARIASTARRQRKMDDDDESQPDQRQDVIQLEERSSITETPSKANSKTGRGETRQHRGRSDIKAGRPAERIQRTRAEGGGNKTEEEDGQERRCKEEQKDELMGTEEQAGRPRRKAVGPPIRYLLESEEQSHGPSAANHSKAKEVKVKRRLRKEHHGEERRGWAEPTERTVSSRVESSEGGGGQLCQVCGLACRSSLQLQLSAHRRRLSCRLCNRKFSCTDDLCLHRHRHHHGNTGGRHGNRAAHGSTRAADDKQDEEVLLPAPTKAPDWSRCRERVRRNPQWWVDYRTTKRRRHDVERWRRRQERDGGGGRKGKRYREEEEEEKKRVCWRKEEGGEEGERRGEGEEKEVTKEVVEQPQRPRRKMVGPPIRYLLESEEQSHGPVTANQHRGWGFKQGRKPQKKSEARGGASDSTAIIDRPEDAEQTDRQTGWTVTQRQTGWTNQDRENGPQQRRGRPKKVVIDSEAGGGASEMTDRSEAEERQTGHMITLSERQTGRTLSERQTGQTVTDRQTGQTVTDRQTGQTVTDRQTERQTGQSVTDRQTGLHRGTYRVDLQSGQVTVIPPSCVRLQRLF